MRGLLRTSAVFAVASILQGIAMILAVPFLTRHLVPAEFGAAVTGLIVVQVAWILTSIGLPAAITRQYFTDERGPEQSRRLISLAYAGCAVGLVVTQLSVPVWAPALGFPGDDLGARAAAATGVCLAAVNATQAYHRSQGAAGAFVTSVALSALLGNVAGVLACVAADDPRHVHYLAGLLLGAVIALVVGWRRTRPRRPRRGDLHAVRHIALPTLPHMLAIYLLSAQDRFVVAARLGNDEVARYQVAYLVGSVGMLALQAVNNAWAPAVLGAPADQRRSLLHTSTRGIGLACGAAVAVVVWLAPVGLSILAPADGYDIDDLTTPATIIACCLLPALVYLSHSHVLYLHGRMSMFAIAAPLGVTVGLGVSWWAAPTWGLTGVAVGALGAQLVLATLVTGAARRSPEALGLLRQAAPGALVALVAVSVHAGVGAFAA